VKLNFLATFATITVLLAGSIVGGCANTEPEADTPPETTEEPAAETTGETPPETAEAEPTYNNPLTYQEDGIAIDGADPVAYFSLEEGGDPVFGSAEYEYEWNGAKWMFSSQENLDAFAAEPEKYAPEYGGYCAKAVSEGNLAPTDPVAWSVVDDKLYLNYNLDVQEQWEQDIPGNIAKANENWPGVLNN